MDKIKNFVKSIKIVDFVPNLICVFGFCYQVYLILHQYMLGKTVVNIEVKRLEAQPLPAITICIPAVISISKLSNLSEFDQRLYQDYMILLDEGNKNQTFTEEMMKTMIDIYLKIIYNNLGKIAKFDELFE